MAISSPLSGQLLLEQLVVLIYLQIVRIVRLHGWINNTLMSIDCQGCLNRAEWPG